jgi:cell division protein FtsQ
VTPGATSAPPRPRPPIDPRLRARRIAVRRDEGRRRLRRFVVALVIAAVLSGAAAASRSPLLDVDHIDVRGAVRTDAGAVIEASGIAIGDPMTDVEVGDAEAAIETMPWVAAATISRRWPNKVIVELEERSPVATAPAAAGGVALLDGSGRVLEHGPEAPADLPGVAGAPPVGAPGQSADPVMGDALALAAALPGSLRAVVAEVAVGEDSLRLELRSETTVELGDAERLEEKLLAVLTVLEDVDPATVRLVDVRVPSAPVLTRRG